MKSLRLRLVVLLSIGLGLAWLVAAWYTHLESRKEISELFDAQLAQSAQVLLGTTRHELHERSERDDEERPSSHEPLSHEYEQKLIFQIWDEHDLLLRSSAAPNIAMASEEGFSETLLNGLPFRVFSRWDKHHEFMIQVAEPMDKRESLALHITLKMLFPTLIAFPVLALMLWLGVGAGLRPLKQLKQEVKQRAANQLEPLATADVPEEVAPLVNSLNDLFARLEKAFEGERRFTADAAHELRTPLAALKIQAQVAMRSSVKAERNAALENVLRGVDRATRLVEQLLTLARVDPETASKDFQPVDLHRLVVSIIADVEPLASEKKIELQLENGSECFVQGESTQLGLLLRNLLDNAIRYTPAGGSVSVRLNDNNGVNFTSK